MELWIRSQSKKLLEKAETIKIAKYEADDSYSIVVNNDYVFGEYQTEERALKVLDEIQSLLLGNRKNWCENKDYTGIGIFSEITKILLYEMPEE